MHFTDKYGLYRSNSQKVLLGVCGGIAEKADVNPWLVRLMFLGAQVVIWPMFFIYLVVGLFVMGKDPNRARGNGGKPWQDIPDAYADAPVSDAVRRARERFETLDRRLQRLESIVTRPDFEWDRNLR